MASKKESTFINMTVVLFLVSAIAATTLGFVYKYTKGPIDKAKVAKINKAIGLVVPEFDNNPYEDRYKVAIAEGDSLICYPAKKGNELVGLAVRANTKKGFSGQIWIMVGFKINGVIHNIAVLEHKETPGLGDKMQKNKSDWSKQFNGKNPVEKEILVKQDNGEIDAITASTITSRAFCDAVDRASRAFKSSK